MTTLHPRLLRFFSIALMILLVLVIVCVFWPIVKIPLRLSRNGEIARQLVQSLKVRFPGSEFRGAASYEREVIYITVLNHLDDAERRDIEKWLQQQKIEQNVAPQIWLRIAKDKEDNVIIIK